MVQVDHVEGFCWVWGCLDSVQWPAALPWENLGPGKYRLDVGQTVSYASGWGYSQDWLISVGVRAGGVWEISVPSSQICCKPKTAL